MFKGNRKIILGMLYMAGCFILGSKCIAAGMDLTGAGIMFGGIATGLAAIVWGNVQEHKAKNGGGE